MTHAEKILQLAKHSPLTTEYLETHGIQKGSAFYALDRLVKEGKLTKTPYTVYSGATKAKAFRYTLPKKNIRQQVMDFINERSAFTSTDVAKALNISRNSAISALTDLENAGQIERFDTTTASIKFRVGQTKKISNTDKCLQELKKCIRINLNVMYERPYAHNETVRLLSQLHGMLEQAEVQDVL